MLFNNKEGLMKNSRIQRVRVAMTKLCRFCINAVRGRTLAPPSTPSTGREESVSAVGAGEKNITFIIFK